MSTYFAKKVYFIFILFSICFRNTTSYFFENSVYLVQSNLVYENHIVNVSPISGVECLTPEIFSRMQPAFRNKSQGMNDSG